MYRQQASVHGAKIGDYVVMWGSIWRIAGQVEHIPGGLVRTAYLAKPHPESMFPAGTEARLVAG